MNRILELQNLLELPYNSLHKLDITYPGRFSTIEKIKLKDAFKTCYYLAYAKASHEFATTTFIEALTPEVAAIILATAPTLEDLRKYLVRECLVSTYSKGQYTRMLKATEKIYQACITLVPALETYLRKNWDKVLAYLPTKPLEEYLLSYINLTYLELFEKVYNHELKPTEVEKILKFEGRFTEY